MFVTLKSHPTFAHDVLGNEFNKLFNTDRAVSRSFAPAMDIAEHENEFILMLEAPGVKKDDVKLHVENDVLTITGDRRPLQLDEKASLIRNEIASGTFSRTLQLSKTVDAERITAELNNGILKVVLPKKEAAKPRTITIN